MLQILVPGGELYNDSTGEFIYIEEQTLTLEHSLVSLSKWEAKWCKPFLSREEKTSEEVRDYIRCMTTTPNVKPEVYTNLTNENFKAVREYIEAPMTATTFSKKSRSYSREIVTSELIYYWMITLNIPWECQKWHLNRLMTLIQVCNLKNEPPQKMSQRELMTRNAALNAARRKRLNSKG